MGAAQSGECEQTLFIHFHTTQLFHLNTSSHCHPERGTSRGISVELYEVSELPSMFLSLNVVDVSASGGFKGIRNRRGWVDLSCRPEIPRLVPRSG